VVGVVITNDEGVGGGSSDPVDQARRLTFLLHEAAQQARDDFASTAARFGVHPPLARVMLLLADPTPMRSVAAALRCDPSYVTGVADDLETAGLAERVVGQDRRVKLLALTPRGQAVRAELHAAIGAESTVMRALDDTERATLSRLLTRLLP
jgi:DNA-binding MarR family transcriptional regulator